MKKLPTKLKIGAHTVTVTVKAMENCGEWDETKSEISIGSHLPKERMESTLIHEIIHVFNTTLSETREGHILQDSLAEQLYQVLKDNKLSFND